MIRMPPFEVLLGTREDSEFAGKIVYQCRRGEGGRGFPPGPVTSATQSQTVEDGREFISTV